MQSVGVLTVSLALGLLFVLVLLAWALRAVQSARGAIAALRQEHAATAERARRLEATEGELSTLRARFEEEQAARAEAQGRLKTLEGATAEAERLARELSAERERRAEVEKELEALRADHKARIEALEAARLDLERRFAELAQKALETSAENFLKLVGERHARLDEQTRAEVAKRQEALQALVAQFQDRLGAFDTRIGELEKARAEAYGAIVKQVEMLAESHKELGQETRRLVQALRAPKARGRWGEMQLRRVFELAGMTEHVDFVTQSTVTREDERLRPDAVVHIPGGKRIVIDAKTPLEAYLDALEAETLDKHRENLRQHAQQMRAHVRQLSGKDYQQALGDVPDFVVMFVPGESFVSAAVEADPGLLEFAFENRVLIASPTTLVALVKAIAYGWQQEKMAKNAAEVQAQARELYDRLGKFLDHMSKLGRSLGLAMGAYNEAVGSLEGRVLPAARRFETLGVVRPGSTLPDLAPIERDPRPMTASELSAAGPGQEA